MDASVPPASQDAAGDGRSEDGAGSCRSSTGRASGVPIGREEGRRLPGGLPRDDSVDASGTLPADPGYGCTDGHREQQERHWDQSDQGGAAFCILQLHKSRKAGSVLMELSGTDVNMTLTGSASAGSADGQGSIKASERGPTESAFKSNDTLVSIGSHELHPFHESIDLTREQSELDLNGSSSNSMQSSQSNTDGTSSTPSRTSGESSEGYSSDDSIEDSKNLSQNKNGGILQVIPILKSSVNSKDASNTEKQNQSIPCATQQMACDSKSSGIAETARSHVGGKGSMLNSVDDKVEESSNQEEISLSFVHENESEVLLSLANEQPEVTSKFVSRHSVIPSKDVKQIVVAGLLDGTADNCHGQSVSAVPEENEVLTGLPKEPDAGSEFRHLNDVSPCNDEVPEGPPLGPSASDSVPKRITPGSEEHTSCYDIRILPAAENGPTEPAVNDTSRSKKRWGSPPNSTDDDNKKSRNL